MYTTNDETDTAIAALEKQLDDLQSLLDSSVGKQANAGQDDGDNADDTIEIAKLQSQVAELGKSLTDAIAAVDKSAGDTFVQVADDIVKRDGCSRTQALQRARTEAPDQFRRYQMAGVEIAKAGPAQDRIVCSPFDDAVAAVMRSKKVPRHIAMQLARKDDPALFKTYQAGA